MRKNGWTPEEDALLKAVYQTMDRKLAHQTHFPHKTFKAMCKRAEKLGVRRPVPQRANHTEGSPMPKKAARRVVRCGERIKAPEFRRHQTSCYGYIPGGPVPSVFDLARSLT